MSLFFNIVFTCEVTAKANYMYLCYIIHMSIILVNILFYDILIKRYQPAKQLLLYISKTNNKIRF